MRRLGGLRHRYARHRHVSHPGCRQGGQEKLEREFEGHLRVETDILDTIVFGKKAEYPNADGDIMGYTTSGFTIMDCYVLDEMKRRMGLP